MLGALSMPDGEYTEMVPQIVSLLPNALISNDPSLVNDDDDLPGSFKEAPCARERVFRPIKIPRFDRI